MSSHSLQKVVEINLNKQNRFAENKTRTPKLLQSACFHKAPPVSQCSTAARRAASDMNQVSARGLTGAETLLRVERGQAPGLGLGARWSWKAGPQGIVGAGAH